jgi:ribosomal-protein-serine acetyltransferase
MPHFNLGDGLELKSLVLEHSEALYAAVDSSRGYLREWLPWVDATLSPRDSVNFIESARRQEEAKNGFQLGIWQDGVLVGCIGFHSLNQPNRRTSLGYWLRENAQGRGLALRAVAKLVDHAFDEFKMHRLEIRCGIENLKSRAIPEKLGFGFEGIARDSEWIYDHFIDHAVYAVLAPDWKLESSLAQRASFLKVKRSAT